MNIHTLMNVKIHETRMKNMVVLLLLLIPIHPVNHIEHRPVPRPSDETISLWTHRVILMPLATALILHISHMLPGMHHLSPPHLQAS